MKKTLIILAVFALSSSSVLAVDFDDLGTPEVYKMNFVEFAMRNTAGTWVIIKDDDSIVDLASADPGELADAIAGGDIPAGSYDMFRSILSMRITIKGAVKTLGGDIYYTTAVIVNDVPGENPGDEPGEGGVPGAYGVYAGTVQQWYDEVEALTIVVPAYAECTIKPPAVPEEHEVSGADDVTVAAGDIVDTYMEADVADGLHLLTIGATTYFFPAEVSIIVD